MVERIVGSIRKHPVITLFTGLLLIGGLIPGMGKISADFTYRAFFYDDDPLIQRFDKFERQFGNDASVVVAVHSPSGIFDVESAKLLQALTQRMWKVPWVIRVDSLSNFNWVHANGDDIEIEPMIPDDVELTAEILEERKRIALAHETLPNYLISKDGKTAMLFAAIKPGIDEPPDELKIVAEVRKVVADLQRGDHTFHLSGGPPLSIAFAEATQADMQRLIPFVLLMTVLLLGVLLRRVAGILLALLVVFLTISAAMAVSGWLGRPLNSLTATLPQILIAIGIADSVHILVTFYRAMERGVDRKDAAEYALAKNFVPTVLTSLSTAIGFYSFSTAPLKAIASLGILAGSGTLLAWFVTYLVLGPILFLLPQKPKPAPDRIKAGDGRARRLTDYLATHRRFVLGGFTVLCLAAAAISTQNTVDSDPFKYFQKGYPVREANEFIEAQVGGARGVELVIDTGAEEGIKDPALLSKVEALQEWIEARPRVTRTVSIVDVLKQTNRSLHGDKQDAFVLADTKETIAQELFLYTMSLPQGMDLNDRMTLKNDALRVTVLWTIPTSTEFMKEVDAIVVKAGELGLNLVPTGKNMLWQAMNGYVVRSFLVSLSAALVLISLLLIVFFRSPKLGLLAMIPNVIPLIIGGAALWLLGQPLDVGTVLVTSVCLGIAVDDTIHILANYNRLRVAGKSPNEAVFEVLANTGPALIVTSLVLVTAFGTFIFATFTPNLYFGLMTAIILVFALVTDLTFLPALLLTRKRG